MTVNSKPILLDGGMGQEIVNRGGKGGFGEWAVAAVYEDADLVRAIHCDYIRAGADVITTNTYARRASGSVMSALKIALRNWQELAGELAIAARAECKKPNVRIAASLRRWKPAMSTNSSFHSMRQAPNSAS